MTKDSYKTVINDSWQLTVFYLTSWRQIVSVRSLFDVIRSLFDVLLPLLAPLACSMPVPPVFDSSGVPLGVSAGPICVLLFVMILLLLLLSLLVGSLLLGLLFPVPHSALPFMEGFSSLMMTASMHCLRSGSPGHEPRIFTLNSTCSPLCFSSSCFLICDVSGRKRASSRCSLNRPLMTSPVSPSYFPLQVSWWMQ